MPAVGVRPSGAPSTERGPARPLAAGLLLGALVLAALQTWRGLEYWNYSEGVYALTARLLLEGRDVYGEVVVAQPPGVVLAGGALLALDDSLGWLRLGVGALQLAGGGLAATAAWRLTRSPTATAFTPALVLLTPWAVREHGSLTPELVALPLLLGGALLASRRATVPAGAVLAALAPFVKWPFVLPAAAIVLLSADRRRAIPVALATLAVQALIATAVFGPGVWEQSVIAQLATEGRPALASVAGSLGQAGWGLTGLLVAAGVALRRTQDPVLARVLAGGAVGALLTVLSVSKPGTALNVVIPVEALLVPLAVAGVAIAAGAAGVGSRAVAVVALLFVAAQTASLLATPQTRFPFLYPTSERGAWGREATEPEVDAITAGVEDCPPGQPYAGAPFFAYLADRGAPAGQPDGFLTRRSSRLEEVERRMAADQPACPPVPDG